MSWRYLQGQSIGFVGSTEAVRIELSFLAQKSFLNPKILPSERGKIENVDRTDSCQNRRWTFRRYEK